MNALPAHEEALDRIHELLSPGAAGKVVARALPCIVDGTYDLLQVIPHRIDVRSRGRVDLTCATRVRCRKAQREESRPVFLEAAPDGPDTRRPSTGANGLVGDDARTGTRVWMSPADPRMRGLPKILSAPGALPAKGEGWTAQVLGHRFGRRAVIRLRSRGGDARDRILKTYARGAARPAAGVLDTLSRASFPFRTPEVLLHDGRQGIVLMAALPGASLHDLLPDDAFPAYTMGRSLREAQRTLLEGLPAHDLLDELAVIDKMASRAALLDAHLADQVTHRAHALVDRCPAPASSVVTHRDLHDKQVLVDGHRLAVLDWDLACVAAPGLDPGNFLAHLSLRSLQRTVTPTRAATLRREFLRGLADAGGSDLREMGLWEALSRLRLAAVYALRPGWPGLGRALLRSVSERREAA